jgi:hypothetical protein
MATEKLTGYCMKTKRREEFATVEIVKTKRGGYMAKGKTAEGYPMCAMISEAKALEAIKAGIAKKSF